MTLCVAVTVPCKALNPMRRPLAFSEPGIVLAADTRFVWLDGSRIVDDGIKIWPLNDWAIAGFSGDVELGEVALFSMRLTLRDWRFRNHDKIAGGTRNWLRYHQRTVSRNRDPLPIEVLLCIHDAGVDEFLLYVLSSQENFEPTRREGVVPIGSGAARFEQAFPTKVDWYTHQWSAPVRTGLKLVQVGENVAVEPRQPDDHEPVRLLQVAGLVVGTLDSVLQEADLATVGGLVQAFMLSKTGLVCTREVRRSKEGSWYHITARDLQSYSNMVAKRYEIPHMREDLSIEE